MRVICIDDRQLFGPPQVGNWVIKMGCIYDVVQVVESRWGIYYELSIDLGVGYPCENFSPLSDIDETEFERSYNKQTV